MIIYKKNKYSEKEFFDIIEKDILSAKTAYEISTKLLQDRIRVYDEFLNKVNTGKNINMHERTRFNNRLLAKKFRTHKLVTKRSNEFREITENKTFDNVIKYIENYIENAETIVDMAKFCTSVPIEMDYKESQKAKSDYEQQILINEGILDMFTILKNYLANIKASMLGA